MTQRYLSESSAASVLTPNDALSYLRTTGWQEETVQRGRASVWTKATAQGDKVEALVPLSASVLDYRTRIRQLIDSLEAAEGRSRVEILADLAEVSSDTIRVATGTSDSIRLSDGAQMALAAHEMLLASACAAILPRAVYHTRKPEAAVSFASRLELGQTERGSYVMRILSRVPPALVSPQVPMPWGGTQPVQSPEPFERQALVVFVDAILAAHWAGQRALATGSLDEFQKAVGKGVSANFCAALSALRSDEDHEVRVGVTWAKTRPPAASGNVVVSFDRHILTAIGEAGRVLRETLPEPEFEVVGPVVQLAREAGAPVGKVTISALIDGQLRRVMAELGDQAYTDAIAAHASGTNVSCYGELRKGGRMYTLFGPKGFRILPPEVDPA